MNTIECPRESDVLMMVVTGRWPDRVPNELRVHVESCGTCAELAVAARAIDEEAEATRPLSRDLPSAGTVWWRAQLRARQEAVRDAFAAVFQQFPDARWNDPRHFVHDDRGVSEWTFTGTLPDGRRVEVRGCDLLTFRDGKIAVKNSFRKNRPPIED